MSKRTLLLLLTGGLILAAGFGPMVAFRMTAPDVGSSSFHAYLPYVERWESPIAGVLSSNTSATAPAKILFDASASVPPESDSIRYTWDFGDGTTGEGPQISHDYLQPGKYQVQLTITDEQNITYQMVQAIQVNEPAFLLKNVIMLIGDGMGPEHIIAAGIYQNGSPGTLPFESFPYQAQMTTGSASDSLTDSAAASTAMATGWKVNNRVISLAQPGDGSPLYTLLEYARDQEMSTGLVTTTPITHATPAGFGAHAPDRNDVEDIANDYLNQTRPNILFGGGGNGMSTEKASAAGYTVVVDRASLLALDTEGQTYVSGQFGSPDLPFEVDGLGSMPHLSEMTATALRILDNDPDGLFLMVEGGRIDGASHDNDTARMIGEMVEFGNTVQVVLDWANEHPGSLVIVLADHETGGLKVTGNYGAGVLPGVTWETTGHTPTNVRVFLTGPDLDELPEVLDNTEIPALISGGKFSTP